MSGVESLIQSKSCGRRDQQLIQLDAEGSRSDFINIGNVGYLPLDALIHLHSEVQMMPEKTNGEELNGMVSEDKQKTDAGIFLQFHSPELKDLGKHFLTVISGVLAFSVTFSEKITGFSNATGVQKFLLMGSWLFLIVAVVTSGAGLYYNFVAGAQSHGAIIRGGKTNFKVFVKRTYRLYEIAGGSFIIALVLLASAGASKLFNQ